MADLGLILGAALAGGAAGAGGAAKDALKSQQEYMQKDDLIHLQNQLDEQKQLRIQEAHQAFLSDQQDKLFGHEKTMQGKLFEHDTGEKKLDRANVLDNTSLAGENAMAVEKVRASTEMAIASMNRQTSLEVARLAASGKTIQPDAHGVLYSIGIDPQTGKSTATQLTGVDGKPLQGPKNMDATTGAFISSLNTLQENAAKQGDQPAVDFYGMKLALLSSGKPLSEVVGLSPSDVPPTAALAHLATPEGQKHADALKKQFPKYFGMMTDAPAASDASAASGSSATSTGPAGTPPLPRNGPAVRGEQVNRAPLVDNNIPPPSDDESIAATRAALAMRGTAKAPAPPAPPPAPPQPAPTTFAQSIRPPAFAAPAPAPNVLDPVGQGLITQQFTQR